MGRWPFSAVCQGISEDRRCVGLDPEMVGGPMVSVLALLGSTARDAATFSKQSPAPSSGDLSSVARHLSPKDSRVINRRALHQETQAVLNQFNFPAGALSKPARLLPPSWLQRLIEKSSLSPTAALSRLKSAAGFDPRSVFFL